LTRISMRLPAMSGIVVCQTSPCDAHRLVFTMNLPHLERQLAFLREIDRLKSVVRMSPPIDRSRRENSAEHSWHLAMYALVLSEHAAAPVDVVRVVKMLPGSA